MSIPQDAANRSTTPVPPSLKKAQAAAARLSHAAPLWCNMSASLPPPPVLPNRPKGGPLAPWECMIPPPLPSLDSVPNPPKMFHDMHTISPSKITAVKTEPMDLDRFVNLAPIQPDLVIDGLPSDVEKELEAQCRKRRVPEMPMDPSLPPAKRAKLERMRKNRESAQRSRIKKARHKAVLAEQVKLLSAKNNELTKCVSLLTSQCHETQALRQQNRNLQSELYELKLKNAKLKMEMEMRMNKSPSAETRESRTSSIDTSVTETSTSTDSAVGEEASHGGSSVDTASTVSDCNPCESDDSGSGNAKWSSDHEQKAASAADCAKQTPTGAKFNLPEMVGSYENQLVLLNELVQNEPWEVPNDGFPTLPLDGVDFAGNGVQALRDHSAVFPSVESPCVGSPRVHLPATVN